MINNIILPTIKRQKLNKLRSLKKAKKRFLKILKYLESEFRKNTVQLLNALPEFITQKINKDMKNFIRNLWTGFFIIKAGGRKNWV